MLRQDLDTSVGYRNDSVVENNQDLTERDDSAERIDLAEMINSTDSVAERNEPTERYTSRMSHIVFNFDELPAQREETDN